MSDTWGIPGPTFLWVYAGLAVITLVGVLMWRRRYTAGPDESTQPQLTPTQLAFLNGDRELAVYSSLAALRAAGAVTVLQGQLDQSGPLPMGAPELDRAVYAAAGMRKSPRRIQTEAGVASVLDRVQDQLTDQGWLLSYERQRYARRGALAFLLLLVLGVARAFAGANNGKPVGFLVLLLIPVGVTMFALMAVPKKSAAAKSVLNRARRGATHLRPNQAPSWATYGPAGAALGVGLFGAASIWAADPAFAMEAEIKRQAYSSSAFAGDAGGGGGDSGGSSCGGGGGCGGGCGGGGCGG
jgi:uncharacterized protein (TIGR04222 family)